MEKCSVDSAMICMDPYSVRSYRSEYALQSEIMFETPDWALLIAEQYKSGTEWYAQTVAELPYCDKPNLETTRGNLKNFISWGKLVRECSRQILENQQCMLKKVRKEESRNKDEECAWAEQVGWGTEGAPSHTPNYTERETWNGKIKKEFFIRFTWATLTGWKKQFVRRYFYRLKICYFASNARKIC